MQGTEHLTVQQVKLDGNFLDDDGQGKLLSLLSAGGPVDCAQPLLDHAQQLGARYVVVESPYTELSVR